MTDLSASRYRTIVADPPWHYDGMPSVEANGRDHRLVPGKSVSKPLPYPTLTVSEIKALPVQDLAADDSRLFLWTTNRYLPEAFDVLGAWGFEYRQTLIWEKRGAPPFGGSVARNFVEFLLVANRGKPERLAVARSNVIVATRAKFHHSRKPDAFLDLVEDVSPGPYAELFSRRARFGWDYPIGDQSLGGVAA